MNKKQSNTKKVKKAVKPIKIKLVDKKTKPEKTAKIVNNKKVAKPGIKPKVKIVTRKIVKKKIILKKVAKPLKEAIVKKVIAKKLVKKQLKEPTVKADKVNSKKHTLLLVPPLQNKTKKSDKKADKIKPVLKKEKTAKEDKLISKSPSKAKILPSEKVYEMESTKKFKDKPLKSKRGRKPKGSDDDEPEIVHDELVEQLIRSTKKMRSQPKKHRILQTFTNPRASLAAVLTDNNKKNNNLPKKEPKGKFELEYVAHTSSGILFEFLTTPSGLSEWFADDVNIQDGIFTFFWDGSEQKAKLLSFKEEKYVRFQWFDKPDGTYFEFRIERDELTGDISLLIVDFAEDITEMKTSKLLWDSQVSKLLHVIGSY